MVRCALLALAVALGAEASADEPPGHGRALLLAPDAAGHPQTALRLAADAADAFRAAGDPGGLRSAEGALRRLLAAVGGQPVGDGMDRGAFVAVGRRWAAIAPEVDGPVRLVPVGPGASRRAARDAPPLGVPRAAPVERWLAGAHAAGAWLVDLDEESPRVRVIHLPGPGETRFAAAAGAGWVVATRAVDRAGTVWLANDSEARPLGAGDGVVVGVAPDKAVVMAAGDVLRAWRLVDGRALHEQVAHSGSSTWHVGLDPSGELALLGLDDGRMQALHLGEPLRVETLPLARGTFGPLDVAVNQPANLVVAIDGDTGVAVARTTSAAPTEDPTGDAGDLGVLRSPLWGRAMPAPLPAALAQGGAALALVADRGRPDHCPTCTDRDRVELWTAAALGARARGEAASPTLLDGHSGAVRALGPRGFSRWLLSGADDRTALVWEPAATGAPIRLSGHEAPVIDVATVPGAPIALTLASDGVRQWPLGTLGGGASPWSARLGTAASLPTPGTLAVAGGGLRLLRLHGLEGPCPLMPEEALATTGAAWLDERVAITLSGGDSRVWDLTTAPPTSTALSLPERPRAVAASPDGRWLSVGGATTLALWDRRSGKPPLVHPLPDAGGSPPRLRFDPGGRWLAIAGHGLLLWDLARRSRPVEAEELYGSTVADVAFTAGGVMLAQIASGHRMTGKPGVAVLDPRRAPFTEAPLLLRTWYDPANIQPTAFAASADGRRALWATEAEALLLDLRGVDLATFTPAGEDGDFPAGAPGVLIHPLNGPRGPILAAAFAGSSRLVTGDRAHGVWSWDLEVTDPVGVHLGDHPDDVSSVAISSDGRLAATTGADGSVAVWLLRVEDLAATARCVAGAR
ncbi:MAG: hypothetical protein AMXMBFR64_50700 [Myxococcales bacterium]